MIPFCLLLVYWEFCEEIEEIGENAEENVRGNPGSSRGAEIPRSIHSDYLLRASERMSIIIAPEILQILHAPCCCPTCFSLDSR